MPSSNGSFRQHPTRLDSVRPAWPVYMSSMPLLPPNTACSLFHPPLCKGWILLRSMPLPITPACSYSGGITTVITVEIWKIGNLLLPCWLGAVVDELLAADLVIHGCSSPEKTMTLPDLLDLRGAAIAGSKRDKAGCWKEMLTIDGGRSTSLPLATTALTRWGRRRCAAIGGDAIEDGLRSKQIQH
ncbi:hypothetical protein ACLOJK_038810 [Asimina triloba]